MRAVWAVICGTIRDQVDFSLILDYLLRCRSEGIVQGIVLSTWEDELAAYPKIQDQLTANQVAVVTSKPNEHVIGDMSVSSVNYWRQAKQIQAALDVVPTDAIVLKTRTDRALPTTRRLIAMLDEPDPLPKVKEMQEQKGLTKFPRVFDRQIAIFKARTGRILQFADFSFMGYSRDVRKLLNFDVANLTFNRGLVANIQFFIYPFIRDYPIIRDYYRLINFQPLLKDLATYTKNGGTKFPAYFERLYAVYFGLLASHFRIGSLLDQDQLGDITTPIEFSAFFHAGQGKHLIHDELGVTLNSQRILDKFMCQSLRKETKKSHGWWHGNRDDDEPKIAETATRNVLQMMHHLNPAMLDRAPPDELAELKEYAQNTDFSTNQWLRSVADNLDEQPTAYAESMQYNLPGINDRVRQELWQECERSTGASGVLYRFWVEHDIEPKDSAPYLMSSARTDNRFSILIVSRLLRQGVLSPDDQAEARRISDFFGSFHRRHKQMNAEIACYSLAHYMDDVDRGLPVGHETRENTRYAFDRFFPSGFEAFEKNVKSLPEINKLFDAELQRTLDAKQIGRYQRLVEMALEITHDEKYWRTLQQLFMGRYKRYERNYRYSVQYRLL